MEVFVIYILALVGDKLRGSSMWPTHRQMNRPRYVCHLS